MTLAITLVMTMTVRRCLFILCLISIVGGCAKDNLDPHVRAHLEKPDWISGSSEEYSTHLYLSGRSVSAELNKAKRESADDLASNIDKQITIVKPEHNSDGHHKAEVAQIDIAKLLDQETRNYLLQHIRISETWQDPATLAYHVLSTIDRVKVGGELLNEVYRFDEQIDRILQKANTEKDVLQRIAFANVAIEKQKQREKLQSVVKIIKPVASIARSKWDEKKIHQQISKWLNEIRIMPVAQHQEFNLMNAMKDGVTSAGMTVHFGAKPDYILKATFNQGQVKWKDGVYSLEGNLRLKLMDGEWKGQVRGDANWPIEVSALERNQLPQQLVEAITKAHQKNLRATLLAIEE